ncbi:tripartite tricarboxylate transporter permease [Chelativorans sp. AA-79]|uniref:tripartite tricarboxylate transporter permease n=1 Tax=Chelativorans sp. AA-79 TaxID=3028735 RepID=UPI0023F985DC|nr:tripartite tricarboxylate transporter permease [Chelativorans sp. AA-79]WEX12461.1 tripartite tricarboxylate transporter permease [Chelativorans sp. AA-79]
MDLFSNLALGFSAAVSIQNLFFAFAGCLLGTLIGVLPGLGPLATISMLLPFTYGLDPLAALILLAGIYYGAAYGGSTTAILANLPGESSSVVTVIDGYQMARQGRAGVAIATAAIGSFFAGCVGTLVLAAFATPLSNLAFKFGGAEYFSLMVVGLIGAVSLSSGSFIKSTGMVLVGLALGLVGADVNSGVLRFTFGQPHLWEGVNFIILAVGLFAFGEIVASLEEKENRETFTGKLTNVMPTRTDFRRMMPAILRGTGIGTLLGILPGAGITMASFFAYAIEKKASHYANELGHGAIEGVAAPESANNAAAQTAFIPTLTLGVPGSATMALMLGAMVMHNIQPGPSVITKNPELFWGLVASMWLGNLMLILFNLPLVGLWIKILRIPYRVLFPAILLFCCVGIYSTNLTTFDIYLAAGAGALGYIFRKLNCEPAPLILAFVLGPSMEEYFRRALVLANGDYSVFVTSPISLGFLLLAVGLVVMVMLPALRRNRKEIFADEAG